MATAPSVNGHDVVPPSMSPTRSIFTRGRSFRVEDASNASDSAPAGRSVDSNANNDLAKVRLVVKRTAAISRVRSDSALASLRRRQHITHGTTDAQAHSPTPIQALSSTQSRNRTNQRMSLGVVKFGPQFDLDHKRSEGFFDVFGFLGVPMLMFFVSTSLAVLTQAYIQVFPTQFANYLMDTSSYDNGEFWLLPDSEPAPTVVSTTLLVGFALWYLYLAAFMVFFRQKAIVKQSSTMLPNRTSSAVVSGARRSFSSKTDSALGMARERFSSRLPELNSSQLIRLLVPALLWRGSGLKAVLTIPDPTASSGTVGGDGGMANVVPTESKATMKNKRKSQRVAAIPVQEIYLQFVSPNGAYHAYYNVLYDAPKLIFQSITLLAYLRKGFPIALTGFYAALLTFNYLISFYRFQRKRIDRNLIITRLFYLFDLFFAAFAPIVVLAYANYNFHFDRAVYQTKLDSLSPGIFDRVARLYADPVEMSVFRLAFNSLRLTTASTIFTKCSLLLLSVFKWRKIIVYLVQTNHLKQRQMSNHFPKVLKHSSSRRHLLFGIFIFIFFGVGIGVYTTGSILTSNYHCKPYSASCVVVSYHWVFKDESCPCLVYINRKTDPRTFAEWVDPPDATEELSEVAKMGELKVIQIINRKLPSLPAPLRKCKNLEQLILLYTKTEVVPDWAKELTYLRYFHIEGDFTSSLTKLPHDLFLHMKKLSYLHTGIVPRLAEYPSLDGLVNLQTLTIAAPHSMTSLPSFDKLANLRVLVLVELASIRRLPSLQSLKRIKQISIFYRAAMCCNGYLTPGKCDLANYQCLQHADEPAIECVHESITSDDASLLGQVGANICPPWTTDLDEVAPSLESTDVACGGVLFKQCHIGNVSGMCYNGRMQVVYCDTAGDLEKMRRLQIQRKVGIPCDPYIEAWLGCTPSVSTIDTH